MRITCFGGLALALILTACAPAGHIEWTQQWGTLPLLQAQAECRFATSAATPATCFGVIGCAAEQNRTESLFVQCMQAKGWNPRFVQDVDRQSSFGHGDGNIDCLLSSGISRMPKTACSVAGGVVTGAIYK